jgi:hypothetical protein
MFDKLDDKDILNYLMTSEFVDGLTPEESKFLLVKFRYYYRRIVSRNDQLLYEVGLLDKKITESNLLNKSQVESLQIKVAKLEDKINQNFNRKLSLRERISGKIILKNGD